MATGLGRARRPEQPSLLRWQPAVVPGAHQEVDLRRALLLGSNEG